MGKSGLNKLPSLVIFDKDGTLIDFHSTWIPWVTNLAENIEKLCDFEVSQKLYKVMGYCDKTDTLCDTSLLAYGSMTRIRDEIRIILLEEGLGEDQVDQLIQKCWSECHVNNTSKPVPTTNLEKLFTWLQKRRVKIAVCTSDSRASTESALRKLGITHFLNDVVCSDDPRMEPKPSAKGVLKICSELGVKVSETIVIGDTTSDMLVAKAAGVSLIVGVLTGIGTESELAKNADVIINNVSDVTTLFDESSK